MKEGDKLRVIERVGKRKTTFVKEGNIIAITDRTITILKEKKGNKTFRESFCLGDLITKEKKFMLSTGGKWQEIRFKQEGDKITYCKVVRK